MNFEFSLDDGIAFSSDPEDAELVGHVKHTAESVRDLATYVVGENREQCHQCGKKRACRPLALMNERGEPVVAPVCAGCQDRFVEERMKQAQQAMTDTPDSGSGEGSGEGEAADAD